MLAEYAVREAERGQILGDAGAEALLRGHAAVFDRLVAAVTEEHTRGERGRPANSAQRRRECVERLLAGEQVDPTELAYELDGCHLAVLARGEGAGEVLRRLAARLDRRLLMVHGDDEPVRAWLGGCRPLAAEEAMRALGDLDPDLPDLVVAVGEPSEGPAGWRLSHRQADAALQVAVRRREPVVRYRDVALLASIAQDELLKASLYQLYLRPLGKDRAGGARTLIETLRAYYACGRSSASAAASLGITRQTINNRLRSAEEQLERPLASCASQLEAALNLADAGCFP